jgi:gliding motility-associated-like protein
MMLPSGLSAQCDSLFLGNDTTLCEGFSLQLDAGPGYSSYNWNDGSSGQFLTVNAPGEYWCDVEYLDSVNLVQNGDFSSGDVSFSTDYIWGIGGPWGILSEEGTYVIDVNAALTHVNFSPCVDHTSGDGLYMIINGDTVQGENVWCQTVPVETNTDYYFSGWFTSVHPSNPAVLSYYINGVVIETVYLSGSTCVWQNFIKEWNSGNNTEAEICIINQNTELGGNDFGIDDIHLLKICRDTDTISVAYEPAPVVDLGSDTLLCDGQTLELNAGGGYAAYLWSNGSGDSVLSVNSSGLYWVIVTSAFGCVNSDSIAVEFSDVLEIDLGNDTTICPGDELLLDAGEGYSNYLWSDGSTTPTIVVNTPGLYWVTVENGFGCAGSDTINVALSQAFYIDLGPDTTICSGDNYVLSPGPGFASYYWQDGSTASSLQVNNPGMYWVSVTDTYGCTGGDTVIIGVNPAPVFNLGNDTVICNGTSLVLEPGNQFSSYLWQDNSSLPVFIVSTPGLYTVTVTNAFNCEASDEIFVDVTAPEIDLGEDIALCLGDTLFLDPGEGYAAYLWQDGDTDPFYYATLGGTYHVTVTDVYFCTGSDTLYVAEMAVPVADLGGDQVVCEGESLMLEAPEGPFTYTWNGEPGSNVQEVFSGGTWEVVVTNQCGTDSDLILITEIPTPPVDLGEDRVLQEGESIQLDAGFGFDEYVWQDGSDGQFFQVNAAEVEDGLASYWVEVWDGPCKSSDTLSVEVFSVKVPNVITPNGDGLNDTFTPMKGSWKGITRHHVEIYNRWGEKVWESDDFESGWDAKHNGRPVADGTYFWMAEVYFGAESLSSVIKGTVTVISNRSD